MKVVPPAKPRAAAEDTARGLEIIIPARRHWLHSVFLGCWLCGWAFGELTVPIALVATDAPLGPKLLITVWLLFWTFGGAMMLYAFLWSLAGREHIVVTSSMLTIRREIFGKGRVLAYELSQVRDLRATPAAYGLFDSRSNLRRLGIGGGTIAFDHGARTVRFGESIDEAEAKLLVERMLARAGTRPAVPSMLATGR